MMGVNVIDLNHTIPSAKGYMNFLAGGLYRSENINASTPQKIKMLGSISYGLLFQMSERLKLDVNLNGQFVIKEKRKAKINFGFYYCF